MSQIDFLKRLTQNLSDVRPTPDELAKFRFWHVEPLLNQSADLLDRCLFERDGLRLLQARMAELNIDLGLRRALFDIEDARQNAGNLFGRDLELAEIVDKRLQSIAEELLEAQREAGKDQQNAQGAMRFREVTSEYFSRLLDIAVTQTKAKWAASDKQAFIDTHAATRTNLELKEAMISAGPLDYKGAPRRFVWNPTPTIASRSRARWA